MIVQRKITFSFIVYTYSFAEVLVARWVKQNKLIEDGEGAGNIFSRCLGGVCRM